MNRDEFDRESVDLHWQCRREKNLNLMTSSYLNDKYFSVDLPMWNASEAPPENRKLRYFPFCCASFHFHSAFCLPSFIIKLSSIEIESTIFILFRFAYPFPLGLFQPIPSTIWHDNEKKRRINSSGSDRRLVHMHINSPVFGSCEKKDDGSFVFRSLSLISKVIYLLGKWFPVYAVRLIRSAHTNTHRFCRFRCVDASCMIASNSKEYEVRWMHEHVTWTLTKSKLFPNAFMCVCTVRTQDAPSKPIDCAYTIRMWISYGCLRYSMEWMPVNANSEWPNRRE